MIRDTINKDFHSYNIEELFNECDIVLFKSSPNVTRCLNHLYSIKQQLTHGMTLRPRGHNFTLPKLRYQTGRNSFINRSLYKCVYAVIYIYIYIYIYIILLLIRAIDFDK